MDRAGMKILSRFDAFDTLETREDLEALYDVLFSVKDINGKHAVFTPYAVPCNISFEKMAEESYDKYHSELLPETYEKLNAKDPKAYNGAWELWKDGIKQGVMVPQFHGREHFDLNLFEKKLTLKDWEVLTALKNRSYASISDAGWTAAFGFENIQDIEPMPEILKTGTEAFEKVFGFKSAGFTPPAQQFPKQLEGSLTGYGIKNLDKPFVRMRHFGDGRYKREFNVSKRDDKAGFKYSGPKCCI